MEKRCQIMSATLRGIEAVPVWVEVCITMGIPGMSIVGMPDAAINESRERVKSAIKACGFSYPADKVVVNLAPSYLKKSGSGFDLPIALGILVASGQLPESAVEGKLVVGELSLEGTIRSVLGMLPMEICARDNCGCLLSAQPEEGFIPLSGLDVQVAHTLSEFHTGMFGKGAPFSNGDPGSLRDFVEVGGHDAAKRALQIAACGMHGVLMVGPPGSGKTMLASRIPSILPPLTEQEMLETAQIYSVVGEDMGSVLQRRRPFRSPHHSVTNAGLVGGGNPVRPGEISLAHNGVLFLDELGEFKANVLQVLRQPVEQGAVTLVRADGNTVFPSKFMLVCASNPCPCGYHGDAVKACECTYAQVKNYQSKIGGPLIDRIDIQLDVWRSEYDNVVNPSGIDSQTLRRGVLTGREFREERLLRDAATMSGERNLAVRNHVTAQAQELLRKASVRFDLSGRAITRTVSLARTIADMEQSVQVKGPHITEALMYRVRTDGDE